MIDGAAKMKLRKVQERKDPGRCLGRDGEEQKAWRWKLHAARGSVERWAEETRGLR